jgi:uncharacterized membrane protein
VRGRGSLLGRPTFGGLTLGLVFWWSSLVPTLMPRTFVTQAAMSAICLGIGYVLGTLAGWAVHLLLRRVGRAPSEQTRRWAWMLLAGAWSVALAASLAVWVRWQDQQRELVTLEPLGGAAVIPVLLVTALLAGLLVVVGRLVWRGVRAVHRFSRRHLPAVAAAPVTVAVVFVLLVVPFGGAVRDAFGSWANTAFGEVNDGTNEGTEQPDAGTVSGSPSSLVEWDTLGVQGRDFVAQATTEDQLAEFHGDGGALHDPVRIYVGLRSADTAAERAALAVADLERAGGFDRALLVVATATGSGWIDPDAAEAAEMLYAGDTAIVTVQYSYLPSWISTLVDDDDVATSAATELYNAVEARWAELPEDDRPKLVVFGLSLGSYGAEAAFTGPDADSSIANLLARTDGALFVGAKSDNPIHSQLTTGRDVGSPVWQPVVDDGRSVRFVTRDPDAREPSAGWEAPRVVYIQHPSDPVTFWTFDTLWSRPGWMDQPRGYDVPRKGYWMPIVTWTQGVFDLMAGFGAPPGFGHDYRLDYVDGWALVVPPDGWTEGDTDRLERFLFDG